MQKLSSFNCTSTQLIFPPHTCSFVLNAYSSCGFLLIFNIFFCSFLKENVLLYFYHSVLLVFTSVHPSYEEKVACMHTHFSCSDSPLSEHLSFFPSMCKTKHSEGMWVSVSICLYTCLCGLWCLVTQKHMHIHMHLAGSWSGREYKQAQWDTNPHPCRRWKKQLFLHLQAATCRIYITAALRTQQSSNSRINCTFKQHIQTLKIKLKFCTQNSLYMVPREHEFDILPLQVTAFCTNVQIVVHQK